MRLLTADDFDAFVHEKPVAVIHFDAAWVTYRSEVRHQMEQAAEVLGEQVNFAEVDIDEQPSLGEMIQLVNIPTIAYYRDGELVAAKIGAGQDIVGRTERVLRGEPIDPQTSSAVAEFVLYAAALLPVAFVVVLVLVLLRWLSS